MVRARPRIRRMSSWSRAATRISSAGPGAFSVLMPVFAIWRSTCSMSEIVPRVRQVEGFVDQRKVGNDVADHRVLQYGPVLPRRIMRMATVNRSLWTALERDRHWATPPFDA